MRCGPAFWGWALGRLLEVQSRLGRSTSFPLLLPRQLTMVRQRMDHCGVKGGTVTAAQYGPSFNPNTGYFQAADGGWYFLPVTELVIRSVTILRRKLSCAGNSCLVGKQHFSRERFVAKCHRRGTIIGFRRWVRRKGSPNDSQFAFTASARSHR